MVGVGGLIGLFYWVFAILPNTKKKNGSDPAVGEHKDSQFPNRGLRLLGEKMILKGRAPRNTNKGYDPVRYAGLVYRE